MRTNHDDTKVPEAHENQNGFFVIFAFFVIFVVGL
jgi:hypothetical protein